MDENGNTSLHLALKEKHLDVVMKLIMAKAEVNIQNKRKEAIIHLVAKMNLNDIMVALVDIDGTDFNLQSKYCQFIYLFVFFVRERRKKQINK